MAINPAHAQMWLTDERSCHNHVLTTSSHLKAVVNQSCLCCMDTNMDDGPVTAESANLQLNFQYAEHKSVKKTGQQ
eukprot:356174-Chlamydomonas_euryale.AAC.13